VVKGAQAGEPRDISYQGLMLEYGSLSVERYRSSQMVLSDPELASNLAVDSILSDPTGMLAALHTTVAKEYSQRKWVLARCEAEKHQARQGLEGIRQAGSLVEAVFSLGTLIVGSTGFIAVANLKPPTHRRCLILLKGLLEKHGSADLQEAILKLSGFAHLHSGQVEAYLQDCAEIFERAVQVTQTPVPFGFKLHAHLRPYFIEGAQAMISEGYPREAMFWVWAGLVIANGAIQVDAPEDEKAYFQAKVNHLLSDMGWSTLHNVKSRLAWVEELVDEIFKVADDIVSRNPEITD